MKTDSSDILAQEKHLLLLGKGLSHALPKNTPIDSFREVEFSIFSQFGDDGIIQWLIRNLDICSDSFIEFGVEDYRESTTRFLMMNDNWSGFVLDGSVENITSLKSNEYFWRHELYAEAAFIDRENINDLLGKAPFAEDIGLLHIDLDGNDYWIWKEIHCVKPDILILEYNSVFGKDRAVTVPYDRNFNRTAAHYSNLYFGSSLTALCRLSEEKGYAFVGCNTAGNNAYFVKREKLNSSVRELSIEEGYVESKFRESRDRDGNLTFLAGASRLEAIRGLPVFDVATGQLGEL